MGDVVRFQGRRPPSAPRAVRRRLRDILARGEVVIRPPFGRRATILKFWWI
jgi:hypothetical protein